jgi:hypothetical protein
MPVSTIYITNNSSGCDSTVEENITTSSCTNYVLRLNPNVKSTGPFDITVVTGSNFQTYTGITFNDLKNGIELSLSCP